MTVSDDGDISVSGDSVEGVLGEGSDMDEECIVDTVVVGEGSVDRLGR